MDTLSTPVATAEFVALDVETNGRAGVLCEMTEVGAVLVGGVLRQAFERVGLEWPGPPTLCTLALARRFAPLAQDRKLAALAGSLGIDVEGVHRALVDAETCARIFCALFPKLCAAASSVA